MVILCCVAKNSLRGTLSHKESLQSGSLLLICNPSLLSKNYFVVTNLLAKMSLYVSVFITSKKKSNLEGSYAFHKKSPRRSKIWREKNLIWILWAPSPPLSPHVATPAKVSMAATVKILCVTLNL
jgi:hypothetical protein